MVFRFKEIKYLEKVILEIIVLKSTDIDFIKYDKIIKFSKQVENFFKQVIPEEMFVLFIKFLSST